MNEDLIEKIAAFVERQCPRKMVPGMKCDEYNCTVHWMSAQIRARKFESHPVRSGHRIEPMVLENVTEGTLR